MKSKRSDRKKQSIKYSAEIIRSALKSIDMFYQDDWLIQGGFSFFSPVEGNYAQSLEMHYSGLDLNFIERNLDIFIKTNYRQLKLEQANDFKNRIKNCIEQGRKFQVVYHGKQTKEVFKGFKHYLIKIPEGIDHNSFKAITDKILKNKLVSEEEINELDFFFYKSGCKGLIKIPLPFLSTPTILLVVNDLFETNIERAKFIREVLLNTREVIYNYIYNLLINNLQTSLDSEELNSTQGLLYRYVEEVCKVLLPIKFEIAFGDKKYDPAKHNDYVINLWQVCENTCSSELNLELTTDGGTINTVKFFLTSFHFPVIHKHDNWHIASSIGSEKKNTNFDLTNEVDFPSVWFNEISGYDVYKEQTKTMLESIFNLIYKQWKKNIEAKDHATKSATSRIINRNYAHHIGSHVSHRATADKIYERVFGNYDLNFGQQDLKTTLRSIVEMENRLTRYKDERNEFISGIDSNTHPVPVMFYKDVIQPFIENSLLMDNIAKSEGICWESVDPLKNDGKVKEEGICKLRIRVFYHKDILDDISKDLGCAHMKCCCSDQVPCLYKKHENVVLTGRLSLGDLGIDSNWLEMMANYNFDNNTQLTDNKEHKTTCIHRLPYYKKLLDKDGKFYKDVSYTLSDIEVLIPGTLGAQSIYSLLENHIRNTAKHAPGNIIGSELPVNIVIKISKQKHENGTDSADFFNLELTSNIPTIHKDEQKAAIEAAFKEPIDGDTKALGFADMRINATLLAFKEIRQENLDQCIQNIDYYPKETANSQSISYCMKLTRPCKIIFVGKKYQRFNQEKLINAGIRQYDTIKDCLEAMGDNPRSFEFAVVEKDVFDASDNHDLFLKRLPWRVMVASRKEECNKPLQRLIEQRRVTSEAKMGFIEGDNPQEILQKCWDSWLINRWQATFRLNIFFDSNKALEDHYRNGIKRLKSNDFIEVLLGNDEKEIDKDKSYFEVFFDRHGKLIGRINEVYGDDYSRLSWMYFDKNNADFDVISTDELRIPEISFFKLIEAGVHKVLIIDERARESGLKDQKGDWLGKTGKKMKQYLLFGASARVVIADSLMVDDNEILFSEPQELNMHSEKFISVRLSSKLKTIGFEGRFKERIWKETNTVFDKFDTLIIHRTMLARIEKYDGLFEVLSDCFPNIIITTGGGTLTFSEKITQRTKMLPFTVVKRLLLNGSMSKLSFSNLI
jgi:hypothetical protein